LFRSKVFVLCQSGSSDVWFMKHLTASPVHTPHTVVGSSDSRETPLGGWGNLDPTPKMRQCIRAGVFLDAYRPISTSMRLPPIGVEYNLSLRFTLRESDRDAVNYVWSLKYRNVYFYFGYLVIPTSAKLYIIELTQHDSPVHRQTQRQD